MKNNATFQDSRTCTVSVCPSLAFAPIRRIGGSTGWYFGTWLWRIRGWLDRLVGGIGMRTGRVDPEQLQVGDPVDFWRVEAYEPNRFLRLKAEMKLPGEAWLEFEVTEIASGSQIRQTMHLVPAGRLGRWYWHLTTPLHRIVFPRMLRNIANAAENADS